MGVIRNALPWMITVAGFVLFMHGLLEIYEPAAWVLTGLLLVAVGTLRDWEKGA